MGVKLGLSRYGKSIHRMRVSEKRFIRRIFGPKRDEIRGEWRKLHIKELLCILYSFPNIIR
jgi:hypothetical protein